MTWSNICLSFNDKYYLAQYPDSQVAFRNAIGIGGYDMENSYARIKALRRLVTVRNDDRIGQAIGEMWGETNWQRKIAICLPMVLPNNSPLLVHPRNMFLFWNQSTDFYMNTLYMYALYSKLFMFMTALRCSRPSKILMC